MKEFSAADFEALIKEWITSLIKFAPALIGAIALYFAGRYLINFIVKMVSKLMNKREVEPTLQTFLLQVIRWVLHIALFLTIVQVIGLPSRRSRLARFAIQLCQWDYDSYIQTLQSGRCY